MMLEKDRSEFKRKKNGISFNPSELLWISPRKEDIEAKRSKNKREQGEKRIETCSLERGGDNGHIGIKRIKKRIGVTSDQIEWINDEWFWAGLGRIGQK